jgi:hypothetical protein
VNKRLKTARHHWWPEGLSEFWADKDGCTNCMAWDGKVIRLQPEKFGHIGSGHHIKFSEENPWNTSIEEEFGEADTDFPFLANWLLGLEKRTGDPIANLNKRLLAQSLPSERRRQLAQCLASLIVRSPRSRNNIQREVEYFQKRFGVKDIRVDKLLIAANMRGCQEVFSQTIESSGQFSVLFTDSQEFIFGDGFLHNFPPRADEPTNPRFVVPLLPSVSIAFSQPTTSRTQPAIATILLRKDEVQLFNEIVQIYSRDHIYFRHDPPRVFESFSRREFLQLQNHKHDVLERLLESANTL